MFHLRYVLLCFVEFLGEVLGWSFAGYLDKGHLFTVARQVARRFTHTVVVVSFHEEVWGMKGDRNSEEGGRWIDRTKTWVRSDVLPLQDDGQNASRARGIKEEPWKESRGETPQRPLEETQRIRDAPDSERQRPPRADTQVSWKSETAQVNKKRRTWKAWEVSGDGDTGEREKESQRRAAGLLLQNGCH